MSPTECGVSEFDIEVSIIGGPWPTTGYCAAVKYIHKYINVHTRTHILCELSGYCFKDMAHENIHSALNG